MNPPLPITEIRIKFIPHSEHRYTTCGDWLYLDDPEGGKVLEIRVSKMTDQRYSQMVAVHELVEVILCNQQGVTQEEVDEFDKAYEASRVEDNEGEPGDEPNAPYRDQHCFATAVERMLCAALGISWVEYEQAINNLFE
jgi:hypothetical protein